jgi:hypothetical protein
MRLTEAQKKILKITGPNRRYTAGGLADALDSLPGPTARSALSLVRKGLLRAYTDKEGATVYTRTAQGGKITKTFR